MDLSFDIRGSLKPYERIRLTLEEFEDYFVNQFEEDSSRHVIFERYKNYLNDFQKEVTTNFIQWINGSFVTTKKNPRDIDFVNLIDYEIFAAKESLIYRKFIYPNAKSNYQVDAYGVRVYPKAHSFYEASRGDLLYWEDWFGFTKLNRAKKRLPKGYIEIEFK